MKLIKKSAFILLLLVACVQNEPSDQSDTLKLGKFTLTAYLEIKISILEF